MSAAFSMCVCVSQLIAVLLSLHVCPGVSTAVLCNETPSAALFSMNMSMCCDANEPSLPQTPAVIVLFDPPLI